MSEEKLKYCSAKALEYLVSLDIHDETYNSDYFKYEHMPINVIKKSILKTTHPSCFDEEDRDLLQKMGTYWNGPKYAGVREIFYRKLTNFDKDRYIAFSISKPNTKK